VAANAAARGESLIWQPEDVEPTPAEERERLERRGDLGAGTQQPAHH
jgi:hypothetical protein